MVKEGKTARGFDIITFTDSYGCKCELQKSSIATEDRIWLGVGEEKITYRTKDQIGWSDMSFDELKQKLNCDELIIHNRMHLTQDMVRELLPYLQRFVKQGEII